jgi:hypothetical protein
VKIFKSSLGDTIHLPQNEARKQDETAAPARTAGKVSGIRRESRTGTNPSKTLYQRSLTISSALSALKTQVAARPEQD